MARTTFPAGKRFAFTIIDDTDVATVDNIRPIYRLFETLGMRTTKTVWPVGCPEGSPVFCDSQTLDDPAYRAFVVDLKGRGFEIASHGATMESSPRPRTVAALERFRDTFGEYPRVHANHSFNRENLYWGARRFDDPIIRAAYPRLAGAPRNHYQGDVEASPYWWGDYCSQHVRYVRNLTFSEVNLDRINPSMPYRDPRRPLVPLWFSATDAEGAPEFLERFTEARIDALEREGGVCILATHLAKEYAVDGVVPAPVRERLEHIASRRGWFPTVGELLDWLAIRRGGGPLPPAEWRRMQWRWALDLLWRKVRSGRHGLLSSVRAPREEFLRAAARPPAVLSGR